MLQEEIGEGKFLLAPSLYTRCSSELYTSIRNGSYIFNVIIGISMSKVDAVKLNAIKMGVLS